MLRRYGCDSGQTKASIWKELPRWKVTGRTSKGLALAKKESMNKRPGEAQARKESGFVSSLTKTWRCGLDTGALLWVLVLRWAHLTGQTRTTHFARLTHYAALDPAEPGFTFPIYSMVQACSMGLTAILGIYALIQHKLSHSPFRPTRFSMPDPEVYEHRVTSHRLFPQNSTR